MDVATISALAAAAAAVGAFSVAGVQLYVGHRQSEAALKAANAALMNAQSAGRHTVAEFRQSWTDKVIDALSDYHAILMSIDDGHSLSPDDRRNLTRGSRHHRGGNPPRPFAARSTTKGTPGFYRRSRPLAKRWC
jgi:type II secretory pathway pseudopilin PulG